MCVHGRCSPTGFIAGVSQAQLHGYPPPPVHPFGGNPAQVQRVRAVFAEEVTRPGTLTRPAGALDTLPGPVFLADH